MRIAITGGIAEGKSTVLQYLGELGYETVSSDALARDCFLDSRVQERLAQILDVHPPVEPKLLRAALVASYDVRRAVNRLFHPFVVEGIEKSSAVFIEVPLLVETCLQPMFDQVWVVTCGPEEQLRRLVARDGAENAIRLIELQLGSFAKTPFGDVVLRTNLSLEAVKRTVRQEAKHALSS